MAGPAHRTAAPRTLIGGVAAMLLAACAAPGAPTTGAGATPTAASQPAAVASAPPASPAGGAAGIVRYATQGRPDEAPFQIALARGYFAQAGVNVETVRIDSGAQMVPALASNQVQVGNGAPSAALYNALNRGLSLRIVADYAHLGGPDDTSISLMVRKDLLDSGQVRRGADLRGRPVAISVAQGTLSDILMTRLAATEGVPTIEVQAEYMPFGDMLAALASKKIDAAWFNEPLVSQAKAQGIAGVLVPGGALLPGAELSVLYYSQQFATDQPQAATAFMVAYLRGVRDYWAAFHENKGRAEAIQLLTQATDLKDPRVWESFPPPYTDLNGRVDVDDMRSQAAAYETLGSLQGGVPDLTRYIDARFAEAAVQQLGQR